MEETDVDTYLNTFAVCPQPGTIPAFCFEDPSDRNPGNRDQQVCPQFVTVPLSRDAFASDGGWSAVPAPNRPQGATSVSSAAKAMGPEQRKELALDALAGTKTVSALARERDISRKFISQQVEKAKEGLDNAFFPQESSGERVLFYLPVTKPWLEQFVLGATLICHSSIRGVVELLDSVFDYPYSAGTVHNVLHQAMERARQYNNQQDLSRIRIGANDEIFQAGHPVLVGADIDSTYCYLLSQEDHRDALTWGIRLLEAMDRGFAPEAVIGDAGTGWRAGQALAMPGLPCRGDVFHALQLLHPLVTYLENRAFAAIEARDKLERQKARFQRRGQRTNRVTSHLNSAIRAEAEAITLADNAAILADWMRRDILSLTGPDYATRCGLFDFVVSELKSREQLCPHRIGPVVRALTNQRDDLLAFVAQLDRDLVELAGQSQLPVGTVRSLFNTLALDDDNPTRWSRESALRQQLGSRFFPLSVAVVELAGETIRASSVIENLNSRLRAYFFLRRHLGPDYLALLQFFLNHRRFVRSERPERVGKSPAELLAGEAHPHWLEMLGYTRFSRS